MNVYYCIAYIAIGWVSGLYVGWLLTEYRDFLDEYSEALDEHWFGPRDQANDECSFFEEYDPPTNKEEWEGNDWTGRL